MVSHTCRSVTQVEYISSDMDTIDLPEIYAPECECVYFRQVTQAHVTTTTCNTFTPQIKGAAPGYISYVVQLAGLHMKYSRSTTGQ